jgi:calcium-dependent protein kinase
VKLFEVFRDAKRIYLVMEMCTGGELFDRIVEEAEKHDEGHAFDERGAANYMQQILGAMRYLHENNYVHRDIKPENFLLANKERDAEIKVIDFGLAKKFIKGTDALMKTKAGTPYYVAPQVLQGKYDEKCDIWSCGVIAYILLCGYPPFYGDADDEILRRVKKGAFDFPSPDWDDISKSGKAIIKEMLTKDPEKRPSAAGLLDHSWLKKNADEPKGTVPKSLGKNLKTFTGGSKLKKVALTVIASQIKESEIQELKSAFALLDKNKDGTLTIAEMGEAFKKLGIDGDQESLKKLDTDGSGNIDYTEFIAAALDKSKYMQEEVLWTAFRTFDDDGDGTITKAELNQLLGGKLKDDEFTKFIQENDLDGDGVITFDEFQAMMEKQ